MLKYLFFVIGFLPGLSLANDDNKIRYEILAEYAKSKNYCDIIIEPKKGEIVIQWVYDENGNCTKQIIKVGK